MGKLTDVKTVLVVASSAIMLVLGLLHLIYTFRGTKLFPRNSDLIDAMKRVPLVLTDETTVWKAWLGFNTSHSMAAILFGLVYGYLAIFHPDILYHSVYLQLLGLLVLAAFAVLAWAYWFSVPFIGILISLACYVASLFLSSSS